MFFKIINIKDCFTKKHKTNVKLFRKCNSLEYKEINLVLEKQSNYQGVNLIELTCLSNLPTWKLLSQYFLLLSTYQLNLIEISVYIT